MVNLHRAMRVRDAELKRAHAPVRQPGASAEVSRGLTMPGSPAGNPRCPARYRERARRTRHRASSRTYPPCSIPNGRRSRDARARPGARRPRRSRQRRRPKGWPRPHPRGDSNKLVAEQLGEAKLKEYAKTLAGKGVDLLVAQVKGASSESDFVSKAQAELLGKMLSEQAKKDAEAIAASPAAKALRERLLIISSEQPSVIIAAAIAAAAIAYLANPDLPELAKKLELAKGLTAEGKLDLGKVQQLTVQQASLALKYSSTHFSAGASAGYAGEGDKAGASGSGNVAVGAKEIQFKGSLKVDPDGSVKMDLGQAIDVKKFQLETGVSIQGDKMAAVVSVKVGDKDTYVSGKTTVSSEGHVSLDLGIKARDLSVTATATGLGSDKAAGEATVTAANIFGFRGLDANGSVKFGPAGVTSAGGGVTYSADTKAGRAFINFKAETLAGAGAGKDAAPIGAQGVIGVGIRFP